jgi:hypothetical protein
VGDIAKFTHGWPLLNSEITSTLGIRTKLFQLTPHNKMSSLFDPELFDLWWDQALEIVLSRTKTFIWDAQMGMDAERSMPQMIWFTTLTTRMPLGSFLKVFKPICSVTNFSSLPRTFVTFLTLSLQPARLLPKTRSCNAHAELALLP